MVDRNLIYLILFIGMFVIAILTPQYFVTQLSLENAKQSVMNGKFINMTLDSIDVVTDKIKQGFNVQLSQHSVHTDNELGSMNGNITKLLKVQLQFFQNRTPLFHKIIERQDYIMEAMDAIMKRENITIKTPRPE